MIKIWSKNEETHICINLLYKIKYEYIKAL